VGLPDGELTGTADGTDDLGRLRLLTDDGVRHLSAGEVVRVAP